MFTVGRPAGDRTVFTVLAKKGESGPGKESDVVFGIEKMEIQRHAHANSG